MNEPNATPPTDADNRIDPLVMHVAHVAPDIASLSLGPNPRQDAAYAFLRRLSAVLAAARDASVHLGRLGDPAGPALDALADALADADATR